MIRLKEKKKICRERIYKRDQIERGKSKILNSHEFNNGWKIYKQKEKKYKSKLLKSITLEKSMDLEVLIKNLSK